MSPVVEACPTDNKESAMSLLHSFYCWGHVGVVLLSSLFFAVLGTDKWQILAVVWALVPALNSLLFTRVPIYSLTEEGDRGIPLSGLVKRKTFWVIMLLMLCAGASEQAVSQWASTFAESELHIAKAVGDLAGPMFFAVLMGTSRAFYGKYGSRINLEKFMGGSILFCIISYFLISLSPGRYSACWAAGCADFPWAFCGRAPSAWRQKLCPGEVPCSLPCWRWEAIWDAPQALPSWEWFHPPPEADFRQAS